MLVVIALGGNALLRRGEPLDADTQRRNVRVAARAIAEVAARHSVVVTHGNGPQVGLLSLQSAAYREVPPYPLDMLGAESEGMVGYIIEQELRNCLPDREVAALLTQVEVAPDDPAFLTPSKPIGPLYDEETAQRLTREEGWRFAIYGDGCRRVVASPEPVRLLELESIRLLVQHAVLVICAGGGGVPVVLDDNRQTRGIEAVIDKDFSAALLAEALAADWLLMLTDVPAVSSDWGVADARNIRQASPPALRRMAFEAGTMGPKIDAGCRFVERTGGQAGIGSLGDAAAILDRRAGTVVRAGLREVELYATEPE